MGDAMNKTMTVLLAVALLGSVSTTNAGKPGGGGTAPAYTSQTIGALSGDDASDAWGVNQQGRVVGRSYKVGVGASRAFYWKDGQISDLSSSLSTKSEAFAISSGATEYAVGYEIVGGKQHAVIWLSPPASTHDTLDSNSGCIAVGINEAGTYAVGSCGLSGVIWELNVAGYPRTNISLPPTFYSDDPWDINNGAVVAGTLTGDAAHSYLSVGYVRLPVTGELIFLSHYIGDVESFAYGVSEIVDGKVFVAGTTRAAAGGDRAIRWTVDLARKTVTSVVYNNGFAEGVNNNGDVAGTTNSKSGTRGGIIQTATLYRSGSSIALKAPSGGSESSSRALAGEATAYVVGTAKIGSKWVAARWVVK
jgi:probable HAF family extracellular repeat protein